MANVTEPNKQATMGSKSGDTDNDRSSSEPSPEDLRRGVDEDIQNVQTLSSRRALWGWSVLCFSTGPTNGMINRYVTAAIQSAANSLGHIPGTYQHCPRRSRDGISCVVRFGSGDINYISYLLYLQAISRACEGVISILTAGVADYSKNRKLALMCSIYLFGALALPFQACRMARMGI